jgi:hypothetical protein
MAYFDELVNRFPGGRLGRVAFSLLNGGFGGLELPAAMTETDWRRVMSDIQNDAALRTLTVVRSSDIAFGTRAIALGDRAGSVYAVFRGTSGDGEWLDNALGMTQAETAQQQAAARFINELRKRAGKRRIVVAGHSKGGNKAQYVTVTTPWVEHCFSLDGQGFSPDFLTKYKKEIAERKTRVTLAAERRGFVNCLGLYLHDGASFYAGRRADPYPGHPYGDALPFFHCPDSLRGKDGEIGAQSFQNPIPESLNRLIKYFLTEPKYAAGRKETATGLVSLMMENKSASGDNIAKALVEICVVFMDLVCSDSAFREKADAVFTDETVTMLATFETVIHTQKSDEPSSLLSLFAEQFSKRVETDKEARGNFFRSLKYLALLVMRIFMEPEVENAILDHIFWFIGKLLKHLADILAGGVKTALIPSLWNTLHAQTRGEKCLTCTKEERDSHFGKMLTHLDGCAEA